MYRHFTYIHIDRINLSSNPFPLTIATRNRKTESESPRGTTFVKTFKKKKKEKKNRRSFRPRRVRLFTLETFTRCCESATFTVKREHDETSTLNGPRYFCSFSMPRREYDATHSPFNLHATPCSFYSPLVDVSCSFAYFPTRTPEFRRTLMDGKAWIESWKNFSCCRGDARRFATRFITTRWIKLACYFDTKFENDLRDERCFGCSALIFLFFFFPCLRELEMLSC